VRAVRGAGRAGGRTDGSALRSRARCLQAGVVAAWVLCLPVMSVHHFTPFPISPSPWLAACSCGCYVVSTSVGGVPEVLPLHMTKFAEPEPEALIQALSDAIPICKYHDPHSFHAGESRAGGCRGQGQ